MMLYHGGVLESAAAPCSVIATPHGGNDYMIIS